MNAYTAQPQEILLLAQNGLGILKTFNDKVQSNHQPSARKVLAQYQKIDSMLHKANESNVINYDVLVENGILNLSLNL
jgi:hypothetical protein